MAVDLGRYARRRFGDAWEHVLDDYPVDIDESADASVHGPMFMTWALYEHKFNGRPVVDWYLEDRGRNLASDERGWLEAQQKAWLSILEVTDVLPGSRVDVRDLLTGRCHSVIDVSASHSLSNGLLCLARIVEHEGVCVFCGTHPNPLPPLLAPDLVPRVREALDLPKNVEPARLRERDTATDLISCWQDEVDLLASRPLPTFANTDGDDLAWTTDTFAFTPPSARAEVERRLGDQPDIEPPEAGDKKAMYTFLKGAGSGHDAPVTVIGTARVLAKELRLESNSGKRADALRSRVESLCAGLVRHRNRSTKDMEAMLADAKDKGAARPAIVGPEADALLLDFKRRHYAGWTAASLPALDGLSPKEAAQNPKYRARLVALLKDMELSESRQPEGQRFSFADIRAELGVPA